MPQARFEISRPHAPAGLARCGRARPRRRAASASRVPVVDVRGPPLPGALRPDVREATLDEIEGAGRRHAADRGQVERGRPRPGRELAAVVRRHRPGRAYPGFEPYDDLVRKAHRARASAILITLAPTRPTGRRPAGAAATTRSIRRDFADFARAVGKRYSGAYAGLPKVTYWSIWNEPNHIFFIKPRSQAPRVYRRMVERGLPALKAAVPGARVFVGELAPVGTATKVIGPLRFLQQWLCLDKSYKRLRGRTARKAGCNGFKSVTANGFAHHPYGPAGTVSAAATS